MRVHQSIYDAWRGAEEMNELEVGFSHIVYKVQAFAVSRSRMRLLQYAAACGIACH